MNGKSGQVPMSVVGTVLGLLVGAAGGFYIRYFQETPANQIAGSRGGSGGQAAGGGEGRGGGGGGMMSAGGGGGGQQRPGGDLARTVRNLDTLMKVQGAGLTAAQAQAITPILTSLQSGDKLSDDDASKKADQIDKLL